MNRSALCAVALFALGFSAHEAFAVPIPYTDGFNNPLTTTQLDIAPPHWTSANGVVDWVHTGEYGITCFNNSNGCVDLDGTTGPAGIFETTGVVHLKAHHTYELSGEVSGNQRGFPADTLRFGFLKGSTNFLPLGAGTSTAVIPSTSVLGANNTPTGFNLYSVFYTPSSNMNLRAFFYDVGDHDDVGPILDNVRIRQTAVPLPAAAWLMLSGLAALGAVARRRISGATA